jgi:hypothetical protein
MKEAGLFALSEGSLSFLPETYTGARRADFLPSRSGPLPLPPQTAVIGASCEGFIERVDSRNSMKICCNNSGEALLCGDMSVTPPVSRHLDALTAH